MASEPAWLLAARAKLGTREAAGSANNPTIMGWAKKLGIKVLGIAYNADSVPWCGVFCAVCIAEDGITPPPIAVRAKAWATWGLNIRPERIAPGAVLVFERPGGGHVGFYVGEDATAYHVLGGNQGDRVSIARIEKSRCIARRWPIGRPVIGSPVAMKAIAGMPLSRNER
ncbi:TIGR02594 family protein [Sphingomonas panaciterrae]|uniref:TIGR02594 family protein n=1 Tax=Sphingomonas panaciterrae TaxID=1462999 RepID=UPI002FF18854